MRILIVVLLAILGFIVGFVGGMELAGGHVEWAVMLGSAGGVLGLTLSDLLYRSIASPRRRRSIAPTPRPRVRPPRNFETRLAQYSRDVPTKDSDMLVGRRPSRMPFWSAVDTFVRVPPKSAAFIRRTLLRIRSLLGRSPSQ